MKNKTGLVALIVLAVATLLMIFLVLPNITSGDKAETPSDPAAGQSAATGTGETTTADGKQARAGQAADGTADVAATPTTEEKPAGTESAADWTTPAFDVLRVEPDGSTVVAGRAEPNKKLEILSGDTVVATTDVGPSGDFAAVFDQPLAAGDHQLVLRILGAEGTSKTSEEVATVSVPKDGKGDLLAMVSKPGKASRLITVPEEAAASAGQAGTAVVTSTETGTAENGEQAAADTSGTPPATGESGTAETVAESDAAGTDVAAADPSMAAADEPLTETGAAAGKPQIRVSAVEIEGDRMYVAGNARPGAVVRIYANDKLVGEQKADADGHYVIDGTMPLPVGNNTIRADVMSPDGSAVELRASVPFMRPEGDQVAVVAQAEEAPGGAIPALGLVGGGTFDKLRGEANKAVALLSGLYADGRLPTVEELAAARSATEIALKSLAEFRPSPAEGEAAVDIAGKASAAAAAALARLQALPKDAAAVGDAIASIEASVKEAVAPSMDAAQAVADAVSETADQGLAALATQARDLAGQFEALFASGRNASAAEIQTARSALEAALRQLAAFAGPADGATADAEALRAWARASLDGLARVPANAAADAYGQALAALREGANLAVAETSAGEMPAEEPATAEGGAQATAETTGQDTAASAAAASGDAQPETVEQAPLQESKSSVIIRRGDTLWQISRRVYGRGVRYTTIYLANQDQIRNPDRITPGQVFGVPDRATTPDTEAEQLHRKHMEGG
ncbi:LysM peptidoglycan-binding domain-containing protein [Rhizobium sp. TRM95111]|uniref:LysM peptidoglycan-binding domain-containing protein n=1 Tax=Rhizobium alarense TaxID=2846851 RepID=UPI001F3E9A46|nr:LysM peptidoglycan-binding domain-containing protein [Rhizobium alarense]MCF3641568.1 LysM peptidoglycan-binding domain-containing protein [Rhizobium alarense]